LNEKLLKTFFIKETSVTERLLCAYWDTKFREWRYKLQAADIWREIFLTEIGHNKRSHTYRNSAFLQTEKVHLKATVYQLNNSAKNEQIISGKDNTGIPSEAGTSVPTIQCNMWNCSQK